VSCASCCDIVFASTDNNGFSPANGSGRMPLPALNSAGGVVSPPLYSGIVPAALPAFSAPTAVSVAPSFFASSGVTAAPTPPLNASTSAAAAIVLMDLDVMSTPP
jgi:hypothetical protein